MRVKVERIYHWNIFKPVDCIGGLVFIGSYYKVTSIKDGSTTYQTKDQFWLKVQHGFIIPENSTNVF